MNTRITQVGDSTTVLCNKQTQVVHRLFHSRTITAQPMDDSFPRFIEHSNYFFSFVSQHELSRTKMFENVWSSTHATWPRTSEREQYKRIYLARAQTPDESTCSFA